MSASSFDQIKPIDLADIRAQKAADLRGLLREKRRQFEDARFAMRAGQLQKPHLMRRLRKDLARVATVLTSLTQTATGVAGQDNEAGQS